MQLDTLTKLEISKLLKKSIDDVYYSDFTNLIKKSKTKFQYEDIVQYLIDKFIQELPKQTKITAKIVSTMEIIIGYSADKDILMSKDTTNRIVKSIIRCKEKENDEFLFEQINKLEETLKFCYPQFLVSKDMIQETENSDNIKQLETSLNEAQNKVAKLETIIDNLERKITKQNKDYEIVKQQKITLTEIKNQLESQLHQLEKEKINKDTKLINLEKEILEFQTQFKKIEHELAEKLELMSNAFDTLNDENKANKEKLTELERQANRTNLINETIITCLYRNQKITINDIIHELTKLKINTSHQEVYQHLMELKGKIKIDGPLLNTMPPSYKINKQEPIIHNPFNYFIPDSTKELNILVKSDSHITPRINVTELQMQNDILYNYCSANNIQLILDLGDTFDIFNSIKSQNLDNLNSIRKLIDTYVNSIPQNTGIYQANLGGNHDSALLEFGINPLELISNQREDLINLGFYHRQIQLGSPSNILYLHHPNRRFQEVGMMSNELQSYFHNFYNHQSIDKDNIYCDLIGHTHKSKLDIINSYCQVPSYTKDRVINGCWHLKIYFDNNNQISYINFIPLITNNNKLTSTTEIPYQKIKRNNTN
ncbi:MAG: hypothetical protein IJ509_03505 [Bacilli bacterium]|nr:hypothetical protein [Bacilli bacterium]